MFDKFFESRISTFLFILCFIFIEWFRNIVILYLMAKFFVMLVEGIVRFVIDIFTTLTKAK